MSSVIYVDNSSKLTKKEKEKRNMIASRQRQAKKEVKNTGTYKPSPQELAVRARARAVYEDTPSLEDSHGTAAKKESPQYTGTNMIGIGQMHKSNAVPIFSEQEAEDVARMRR